MTDDIRPDYYGGADNPYEVIKVAEAWGLDKDSYLFNVLKYISRPGKGEFERDLVKARFYLDRRIQRLPETEITTVSVPSDEERVQRRLEEKRVNLVKLLKPAVDIEALGDWLSDVQTVTDFPAPGDTYRWQDTGSRDYSGELFVRVTQVSNRNKPAPGFRPGNYVEIEKVFDTRTGGANGGLILTKLGDKWVLDLATFNRAYTRAELPAENRVPAMASVWRFIRQGDIPSFIEVEVVGKKTSDRGLEEVNFRVLQDTRNIRNPGEGYSVNGTFFRERYTEVRKGNA